MAHADADRQHGPRLRRWRRRRRHGALPRPAADRARRRGSAGRGRHARWRSRRPTAAAASCARCTPNCTSASPTRAIRSRPDRQRRRDLRPLRIRPCDDRAGIHRRPAASRGSTATLPIPVASGRSSPAITATRPRGDLRAMAAAHTGRPRPTARRYGTNCSPIASRFAAAEPSGSRSCIPTATPCIGYSATTRCCRVDELIAATTDAHIALCRALLGLDLMEKVVFAYAPRRPAALSVDRFPGRPCHPLTRTISGCASWTSRPRSRRAATRQMLSDRARGLGRIPQ